MIRSIEDLKEIKKNYLDELGSYKYQVLVCGGTGCISANSQAVCDALYASVEKHGLNDKVKIIPHGGCMGTCAVGPIAYVLPDGTYYTELNPEKVEEIVEKHFIDGAPVEEYTFYDNIEKKHVLDIQQVAFFKNQVRIALRNCGLIDVDTVDAYIAHDGYLAIAQALQKDPKLVIDEIKKSGLRGRGGAGFPTGIKWEAAYNQKSDMKYMVCNADEGDPGAFMDRSVFEGDPHSVIEGMMIAAYGFGASQGYIYIRAEYPVALHRLEAALDDAHKQGILGKNIFGSDFSFDIEVRVGAGAFVCGEETALMNSVEGKRGEPRQKPPFPFESGLYGKPTIINNVETLANVPAIILNGADWFRQYGTEKSPGTKVFALSGKLVNTGLIEVPMGIPLGDILYTIGGGCIGGKTFKAIQTGGPSGGCLTAEHLNTPMDYESLTALGAIMGSGGLVVMDEDTCMVDTARYFMDFVRDESCGKCLPCRVGTTRMLEILERITKGQGTVEDIGLLKELAFTLKESAMCGLGQTASNPVLSTLRYFEDEYMEHIKHHHCEAGVCSDLFISPCENACPANVNVPGYMALISSGRFIDAYDLIRQENPMPSICGRICTHPCEKKCRRGTVDDPLAICDLKRFVADYAFKNQGERIEKPSAPQNGRKVGVIGAGPSGLTCAYYLSRLGYEVNVYDRASVAGGVLNYGIPEYRLPAAVIDREVREMQKSGFRIHLNTEIGKDMSFEQLRADNDAVYIAIGTQLPQKAGVEGEELEGVIGGLDFLKNNALYHKYDFTGKKVAVIGGGNTAIDSARTALRLGADHVYLVYRRARGDMPANESEIREALEEGIDLNQLASPVRFVDDGSGKVCAMECVRRKISNFDNHGRRNNTAIEGSEFSLDVDVVITAVSQKSDFPFIRTDAISITPWGTLVVDPDTKMTTTAGVFAGGDIARGSDVAIRAIADGKTAAASIDKFLGGTGVLDKGREIDIPEIIDTDTVTEHSRFEMDYLPLKERCNSFNEVVLGYHKLNAIAESMRCLHCDRR